MKIKRFIMAAVMAFIFVFVYESFVHGHLLAGIYGETPNIWRDYHQMMDYIPFNIAIMAILTLWMTFIFTQFYSNGGWKNGLRFGFYIGILSGMQAAGAYYYLPISALLAVYWFIASVIECTMGGLIVGLIYRK